MYKPPKSEAGKRTTAIAGGVLPVAASHMGTSAETGAAGRVPADATNAVIAKAVRRGSRRQGHAAGTNG
ncbi:hypothetical protein SAMN05216252_11982 [Actinacidiphila glaucinigra]|uniref:Uncharacterized protein n=1 Tax=Actinacidiphila glaucinigra TaxID=235986 RepID=A0A239LET1_9ACTN|nr:hypothetical protein SAMN05216252_11982 [Actinacidiphila glaucinigra]